MSLPVRSRIPIADGWTSTQRRQSRAASSPSAFRTVTGMPLASELDDRLWIGLQIPGPARVSLSAEVHCGHSQVVAIGETGDDSRARLA